MDYFLIHLTHLVIFHLAVITAKQCKPVEVSSAGKALKNHTFRSTAVASVFECQVVCEQDLQCQSYNFFIPEKICELNDRTKEGRPQDYVTDETRFYMEIWHLRDVKSCKELYEVFKARKSHVTTLNMDSTPTSLLCHMGDFGCGDGGWTPVMKTDGNKQTFRYNSTLWSNTESFNPAGGETGFDNQETKLPTYWKAPFDKICLGMKIGQHKRFIVINKQASSLFSLIADGKHRNTSLGRDTWKSLIGADASLQRFCNKEGFNVMDNSIESAKARIGIIADEVDNVCQQTDSRLGFGTGGRPTDAISCGNAAAFNPDNGDKNIASMGYILVQ